MLSVSLRHADGREVRRESSQKSLLGFSRQQQVLQANLKMQIAPRDASSHLAWAEKVLRLGREGKIGHHQLQS